MEKSIFPRLSLQEEQMCSYHFPCDMLLGGNAALYMFLDTPLTNYRNIKLSLSWGCMSKRNIFCTYRFCTTRRLGETGTEGWLAIVGYIQVYIYIYTWILRNIVKGCRLGGNGLRIGSNDRLL
jgi:hypothetical protein